MKEEKICDAMGHYGGEPLSNGICPKCGKSWNPESDQPAPKDWREIIDALNVDPYPASLFSPLNGAEWKKLNDFLKDSNISLDRMSAEYARMIRKPIVEQVNRLEPYLQSLASENKRLREQQEEAVDIEKMLTHAVILGQNNIDQNGNYVGYGVEETVKGVMNYFKCSLTQSKSTQ